MKLFFAAAAAVVSMIPALVAAQATAGGAHAQLKQLVDADSPEYIATSKKIWDFAEMGYLEQKSSALLQQDLKKAGFEIQSGVAGEPTAFIASYGKGSPVIAILGEFDALPGLSQAAGSPQHTPLVAGAPGHGCGHNLLGSGAALAATALKQYMQANRIQGTLRYYGSPAEEGGSGKVFMVRAGLFQDVDVALTWHPADANVVPRGSTLAIVHAKFNFHGVAAHAAAAPERGRSALDGIMLMGSGIEFMREHVPSTTRVHYIITKGGEAPNVVPAFAQMEIMARSPDSVTLQDVWARIGKIAAGAAMMTETTQDVEILSADASIVPNDVLAKQAQLDLEEVGGFTYNDSEKQFALQLQTTLPAGAAKSLDVAAKIMPPDASDLSGSTDVGDVSWQVPTMGMLGGASFVPGVAAHTWQATASTGMSIGQKGMLVAAKTLALLGADLYANPQLVSDAKTEFKRRLQSNVYKSMIPDNQTPPLDYRK